MGRYRICWSCLGWAFSFGVLAPFVLSLSTSSVCTTFRKSALLPWKEDKKEDDNPRAVLGHCLEERGADDSLKVSIWLSQSCHDDGKSDGNEDDKKQAVSLTFPSPNKSIESYANTLWPAALASSILLCSPEFQRWSEGKSIIELGCGRGLAGMVAALNAKGCLLTDSDENAVKLLETLTCPSNQSKILASLSAKRLDWIDDHRDEGITPADLVLGSDIAYYHHLLRPIMDTTRPLMKKHDDDACKKTEPSTLVVIGQANRRSQWDLYKNIKHGCYNQITDQHEPPWPGTSRMLLYKLQMSTWCKLEEECHNVVDGVIPMSVFIHHAQDDHVDLKLTPFEQNAHEATQEDDDNILKTF